MQKIKQQCKKVKQNPSDSTILKNFTQSIKIVKNWKINNQKIICIDYLVDVFQYFNNKNLFSKNNKIINNYFYDKLQLLAQIIIDLLKDSQLELQQTQKCFENLTKILILNDRKCQQIVGLKIYDNFKKEQDRNQNQQQQNQPININWSALKSSKSIYFLCLFLKNQILNDSNIESYINFILTLPQFNQIQFIDQIQEQKSMVQTLTNQQKQLKQAYQKLLLKTLSASEQLQKTKKLNLYRNLGSKIFSKLLNPLVLSQFLLKKFQTTPDVQIQVLSSLFILVGKYGLQLDQYFEKLQILITSKYQGNSVYQLPNSRRFFKLIEASLRSSKVPFSIIVKMCEIIIKQIFQQSSDFAFWALSFIYNLTKKHRQLLGHLQKMPEILLLKKHYNPKVVSLIAELDKNLNKSEYLDIEMFSGVKVQKLIKQKLSKFKNKISQNDQITFRIPMSYQKIDLE